MQRFIPILDNGHGGIINGIYQTPGKRSPKYPFGQIFEGAFNRWIVNGLMEQLDEAGIPYFHVSPELRDITLETRCKRTNLIQAEHPNAYLLSIHANGGGGTGIEGFTSRGQTRSDLVCEEFLKGLEICMPNEKMRFDTYSDGDRDKEAGYKLLTGTNGMAILLELGFMDNPEDCKKQLDAIHRLGLINSLFETTKNIYDNAF